MTLLGFQQAPLCRHRASRAAATAVVSAWLLSLPFVTSGQTVNIASPQVTAASSRSLFPGGAKSAQAAGTPDASANNLAPRFEAEGPNASSPNGPSPASGSTGRVEGTLRLGNRPGTNQEVDLDSTVLARGTLRTNDQGVVFSLQRGSNWFKTITGGDGKFVFDHVPPGGWSLSHSGSVPGGGELINVTADKTTSAAIERTGRPVVGKLLIPPEVAILPHRLVMGPGGTMMIYLGPVSHSRSRSVSVTVYGTNSQILGKIEPDGTFRVDDVKPGTWEFIADILKYPTTRPTNAEDGLTRTAALASRKLEIPEIPGGWSDQPLDLGAVELTMIHSPQVGETAPPFEAKTEDGSIFELARHRGQIVLVDFEAMNLSERTNEYKAVSSVWEAFKKNDGFAMLTVQVYPLLQMMSWAPSDGDAGGDRDCPWSLTKLRKLPWPDQLPLRAAYGLETEGHFGKWNTNLPAVFLVGSDGRIVARDLHGDAIKAAVAKALGAAK